MQLVGQKDRDKTTLASKTRFSRYFFWFSKQALFAPSYPGYQRFFLACDGELSFVSSAAVRHVFGRRPKTRAAKRGSLFENSRISKCWWLWRQEKTSWCLNSVIYGEVVYWLFVRSKLFLPLQRRSRSLCHCFVISGFSRETNFAYK